MILDTKNILMNSEDWTKHGWDIKLEKYKDRIEK